MKPQPFFIFCEKFALNAQTDAEGNSTIRTERTDAIVRIRKRELEPVDADEMRCGEVRVELRRNRAIQLNCASGILIAGLVLARPP
jgi:hypothetical protein